MFKHRPLLTAAAAAVLTLSGAATAAAASSTPMQTPPNQCSATYYEGNSLLGPEHLPTFGAVGRQLAGYRRTGTQSPQRFLAEYRNGSGWIYPPDDGYLTTPDGQPIKWEQTLFPGQRVDRYGSVYGSYLAPAGTPYAERALPPSSLDGTPPAGCNYHDYLVLRPLPVDAGPIAAWFDQPGGGEQYQLDSSLIAGAPAQINVGWLLDNGYLAEIPAN